MTDPHSDQYPKTPWAWRLKYWREHEKNWTQDDLKEHIEAAARRLKLTRGDKIDVTLIRKWERGAIRKPQAHYRRILAELGASLPHIADASSEMEIQASSAERVSHKPLRFDFPGQSRLKPQQALVDTGTCSESLIDPQKRDEILVANTGLDTLELLRRVRASAINSSTVDAVNITVEQLCCDYAHEDARELIKTGKEWLGRMAELLAKRVTLDQHRDMLNNAGMLALLVGCLEYDIGDARSAEATRRMAMELGKECGDPEIVGWAHEMLAWFHLTAGNYRAVIPVAQAGALAAPSHSVAVQLHGQQAKAYARLGMVEEVHKALENGRALLDKLPYPARPDHHFVVDPDKWDFYAMDTYRIVGEDQLAKRNAEEVIQRSVNTEGVLVAPMRNAEARLTLAVIAARQGDVEEASALGIQALRNGRQSRPSLLMVASELAHELDTYSAAAGAAFRELLSNLKPTT